LFAKQIKAKDELFEHILTNVSIYYRIPPKDLKLKYKNSEIVDMYVNVLYASKNANNMVNNIK